MVAAASLLPGETVVDFHPHGAARDFWTCRDPELLLEGPAGTGKSFCALWKLHMAALNHPGMRGLMVRKTLVSLTASALVTFRQRILAAGDFGVSFFGGSKLEPAQFRYANGSVIVVGGMDRPSKIMSSEYDVCYCQEALELTVEDWESVTTRLRYGAMPYQQLIADCNPGAPTHWLNQRANAGLVTRFRSRHEDNPELFDHRAGAWTERGRAYLAKLDRLTGVRYERLRLGLWAAAEGMVYDAWDAAVHIVDGFAVPLLWPRWWSVDFGYTNPFVWQEWTADPDGRLYLVRELYQTQRLVEDAAIQIRGITAGQPPPLAVVCDHDAEGRATLEKYLGVQTTAAYKAVQEGIQAVQARLRPAGDGKPRLFFMRDASVGIDASRRDAGLPTGVTEEFESYVWDTRLNRKQGEEPLKEHDHGLDAMRYLVAYVDGLGGAGATARAASYVPRGDDFSRREDWL